MSKIIIGLCAFLTLVITPSVYADPIVITSGSLTVVGIIGSHSYSFAGQNFSVTSSGGDQGSTPSCGPCQSGTTTNLSSFLAGTSLGTGTATINGTTFTNVGFLGEFSFGAANVLLPAGSSNLTLTTPFSFTGNIRGCQGNALICTTPVFSTIELVGQGIATVQFNFIGFRTDGTSLYFFNRITYEFQSSEVPEPLTLTLLTSGLIGLGAKSTRRRKIRSRV